MKLHLLLLVLVLVVVAGCTPRKGEREDLPRGIQISANPNVYRMVDEEAGIACWVYSHRRVSEAGISCLPLSETTLDE
jgi:hypothetical protein